MLRFESLRETAPFVKRKRGRKEREITPSQRAREQRERQLENEKAETEHRERQPEKIERTKRAEKY